MFIWRCRRKAVYMYMEVPNLKVKEASIEYESPNLSAIYLYKNNIRNIFNVISKGIIKFPTFGSFKVPNGSIFEVPTSSILKDVSKTRVRISK